jgi:hypothetical protein
MTLGLDVSHYVSGSAEPRTGASVMPGGYGAPFRGVYTWTAIGRFAVCPDRYTLYRLQVFLGPEPPVQVDASIARSFFSI